MWVWVCGTLDELVRTFKARVIYSICIVLFAHVEGVSVVHELRISISM